MSKDLKPKEQITVGDCLYASFLTLCEEYAKFGEKLKEMGEMIELLKKPPEPPPNVDR